VASISWPETSSDLRMSVTVRNVGEAAAPQSKLTLALSSSFSGESGERVLDVPEIPAGGQITVQTTCFVYVTDRATATADAPGAIDESNESDNVLAVTGQPCRYN
jgi:subtilase family serine protease